jgi:ribonucleotide reductase beta subunit family protein with ferritin-like domain
MSLNAWLDSSALTRLERLQVIQLTAFMLQILKQPSLLMVIKQWFNMMSYHNYPFYSPNQVYRAS